MVRSFAKGDSADHVRMDGVIVEADEAFRTPAGSKMFFPRDPRGKASDVINCRCTYLMIPPEED